MIIITNDNDDADNNDIMMRSFGPSPCKILGQQRESIQ